MHRWTRALLTGVSACASIALVVPASAAPAQEDQRASASSRPAKPPVAATPPMGWSSWTTFGCDVDAKLVKQMADTMVASGMREAGYRYVNIDDCWGASERDARTGRLVADPERFPNGIEPLADYVHARGLKLGLYATAGTRTCAGTMPGSLEHERLDARTFAEWGVDLIKYDNCNNQGRPARERYRTMGEALRESGRRIVFAINEWGMNRPWEWGSDIGGHMWVTSATRSTGWGAVVSLLDAQVGLEKYAGPHGWNDPGGLLVGNGELTATEDRAQFALWALLNAPVLIGNDLRSMYKQTRDVLLNNELIAVNQDWGGVQGHKVRDDDETEVWAKPMSDGSVAVVLLNRTAEPAWIRTTAAEIGLRQGGHHRVRDLWTGTESVSRGRLAANVPAHGAAALRMWDRA